MPFDYSGTNAPIRQDLRDAHETTWEHVAAPGTWWTGAERVAIAAETRRALACVLCTERKAALSPAAVTGSHGPAQGPAQDRGSTRASLPDNVVEVIHRVRTDSGRLTRAWFDGIMATGLEVAPYVEVVSVTTLVTGLDYFCAALGIAPFLLPEPQPGEPTRQLPAATTTGEAWVPMLQRESDEGRALFGGTGMVPNIARSVSVVPAAVRAMLGLISTHYFGPAQLLDLSARRALDRPQIELVAARVSALNECFY